MEEINTILARAKAADLAMARVLHRADLSPSTWWRWTSGKHRPQRHCLRRVQEALEAELAARETA